MKPEVITSSANQRVKEMVRLHKADERKKQNRIIIEGLREITMAVERGIIPDQLFIVPEIADRKKIFNLTQKLNGKAKLIEITKNVFSKMAYRENSDGVIVSAIPKYSSLDDLKLSKEPLIIVMECVEKPGNLGAVLRTADAAGADAVIVCDERTDIYNPNIIRSSLGTVFTNQVVTCASEEVIEWLKNKNIKMYATALGSQKVYTDIDFTKSCAIVFGSEAKGLSDVWLKNADEKILIPMKGKADSLNVSASAAIVAYEAVRQRNAIV